MAAFWLLCYIYLVQGDIGRTYEGVCHSLGKCLEKEMTLTQSIKLLNLCWRKSLYQCHSLHHPDAGPGIEKQMMCGVINTGRQLTAQTWLVKVFAKYSLCIKFLHFHLPCTNACRKSYLKMGSGVKHVYCSKRVPWSVYFSESNLQITYRQLDNAHRGYHFVLMYVVDHGSPSISIYAHHHVGMNSHQYSVNTLFRNT